MKKTGLQRIAFLSILSVIIAGNLFFAGCIQNGSERASNEWVAPSADRLWAPPPEVIPEPMQGTRKFDIPEDLLKPETKWRLMDIIEIALRNNPETRSAWSAARAAAADWQSSQGSSYPQIDATVTLSDSRSTTSGGKNESSVKDFQPGVGLSWLLFDFGGRDSLIEEKRQALIAADFSHNAAIQNVVFQVIQTYFQYANAKVLLKASETSIDEASANLEAAQQRHKEGLATIADVLQAKTALSQSRLNHDVLQGQLQTLRGVLATALGIPANAPYDLEDLPLNPPLHDIIEEVDTYIKRAESSRPDLAAQKSLVERSLTHIRTIRSTLYPSLTINNTYSRMINDNTYEWDRQNITALMVKIPIFRGYSGRYDVLKAEQEAETQKARLDSLEKTIILQVWTSYFNLKTSVERVKTTEDLLKSALQSYDVALGRYKEGVGGFLDLLSAQSTLENARAQRVQALADWYISLSQLAKDTGMLWRGSEVEKGGLFDILPAARIKKENEP